MKTKHHKQRKPKYETDNNNNKGLTHPEDVMELVRDIKATVASAHALQNLDNGSVALLAVFDAFVRRQMT
jgi:hypothetical protein